MELKDKVTAVKGVGPKMEEKLGRLGIHTVEDLISYFPRKYQDWTNITPIFLFSCHAAPPGPGMFLQRGRLKRFCYI